MENGKRMKNDYYKAVFRLSKKMGVKTHRSLCSLFLPNDLNPISSTLSAHIGGLYLEQLDGCERNRIAHQETHNGDLQKHKHQYTCTCVYYVQCMHYSYSRQASFICEFY